jgi:thioredoxin-related protein
MKKRLSLGVLLLLCIAANAAPSIFFDGTWQQARAKAKKENKYIFLDCWTEWCGYCKMMDSETFVDPAVMEFMQKNFVSVSRDMERGEGRLLNMKYHPSGYPTYYIFNPQGELCFELTGYMKPQPWIDTLRSALKPEKQHVCTGFSEQLEPGYPDFYKASFGVSNERKRADSAVAAEWLDQQPDLSSEVSWGVLRLYKGSYVHQQWMFENGPRLYALYGEQVWFAISNTISTRAYQAGMAGNDAAVEELLAIAEKYLPEPFRSEVPYYSRSAVYRDKNQWLEYTLLSDAYFSTLHYEDLTLNNLAWQVCENSSDTVALNIAIKWIEIQLKTDSTWYVHDTYAALLYKTGRLDEAEIQANIAIEKAGREGEMAEGAHALRDKIAEEKKGK